MKWDKWIEYTQNIFNKDILSAFKILKELDKHAKKFNFPVLDNLYVYPIANRLHCYTNQDDGWAIVIECIGFSPRGGVHNGITNCLYFFGNSIVCDAGISNDNFIYLTKDADRNTFDEKFEETINTLAKKMYLNNELVEVIHDRVKYNESSIDLEDENCIYIYEYLRLLEKSYRNLMFASEEQIRIRLSDSLVKVLMLNNWFHPDISGGELPSDNETFQMLAKSIVNNSFDYYQPTIASNTHWGNWPEGGLG